MILFFLTSSSLIVQSKSNDKIHHLKMHITKNAGIILVNKWISIALLKAQNFMAQRLTCHTNFFKLWSIQYKKNNSAINQKVQCVTCTSWSKSFISERSKTKPQEPHSKIYNVHSPQPARQMPNQPKTKIFQCTVSHTAKQG